ncbi:MAG TPA: enoyl-CoA hydratase [Dehalococcoidia bacterium]|jgi:2-(1,2-epoxy-1,2-dihydrophenyl)acetyl-CoA isomerase|nr:enoyl-CoA hydratase [Dehalococcoidia bacterium]
MSDVLFEKRDNGVALITLNRPESLNAMGGNLMPLLAQHLEESRWDSAVRCVVLTGAGRAFCAGGDVKNMAAQGDRGSDGKRSPAAAFAYGVDELRESQRRTSYTLHAMPKPTIAMVNGHAVGAGLSLALACDIRVASDRAKFGTVFRNVGFSGDFGGSYFLQRLVGNELARLFYFTGQIVDAEEAQRIGMVSKVVLHDSLEEEAMALASLIASGPALAYARMKENLNRAETSDLLTLLEQEALNMRLSGTTHDHREAARAFVEKRTPTFSGE